MKNIKENHRLTLDNPYTMILTLFLMGLIMMLMLYVFVEMEKKEIKEEFRTDRGVFEQFYPHSVGS